MARDRVLVDGGIIQRAQAEKDDLPTAPCGLGRRIQLIAHRIND